MLMLFSLAHVALGDGVLCDSSKLRAAQPQVSPLLGREKSLPEVPVIPPHAHVHVHAHGHVPHLVILKYRKFLIRNRYFLVQRKSTGRGPDATTSYTYFAALGGWIHCKCQPRLSVEMPHLGLHLRPGSQERKYGFIGHSRMHSRRLMPSLSGRHGRLDGLQPSLSRPSCRRRHCFQRFLRYDAPRAQLAHARCSACTLAHAQLLHALDDSGGHPLTG